MSIVYLNGKMLPIDQAHIPVFDRGFLFGDSIYEVIPVFNGKLFRLAEHITRLNTSLKAIHIHLDWDLAQWQRLLQQLLDANQTFESQSIYLQISRGVEAQREHTYAANLVPTIFAMCNRLTLQNDLSQMAIKAITVDDIRWKRCDIKSTSLLANVLLKQQALQQGAQEAILINNNFAIEGSASNLFIVKNGTIITPPKSPLILGGITRDLLLELCQQHKIAYQEANIYKDELFTADEIWLTSSSREIMPVIELDKQPVGSGEIGENWYNVFAKYTQLKRSL